MPLFQCQMYLPCCVVSEDTENNWRSRDNKRQSREVLRERQLTARFTTRKKASLLCELALNINYPTGG